MYPSRGNNNAYGQQQQHQGYSGQSAYDQNLGPDGGASQLSMSSRHSAMLSAHPSAGAHYGGQYSSVYGSMGLGSALQAPGASSKRTGSSALEGRSGYGSAIQESPKYASDDYSAVSQKYAQKGEISDYSSGDRRQYVERPGAYSVRDSQNDPTARFADSIGYGHHHQADLYDRLGAASALRKELLQAQELQSPIEGSSRQADYLAARAATVRHAGQELLPYSGRLDTDPNTLSMISGLSHRAQHAPSILGAAPRRDLDDLVYTHTSANPGYGVSLPPGRDYGSGKGLRSIPLEPDDLARAGFARLDERKQRDEERERDRRRELLRDREKERERDRERERERERERKREREHIRQKDRDRVSTRVTEIRRERTPPRISRDRGGSSTKADRLLRRESPRRRSPVKEKRRDYVCKVYSSSLVDVERDYLSIDKRYPRLFTSPECSKVIVNWSRDDLNIPLTVPVSFEHDYVQGDPETKHKDASSETMADDPVKLEHGNTRWNAKIILMSGLSQNALEELSSERDYEDRIPHFCNMLRFACLKNGNSLIAIGGLWEAFDGNDPAVDKSTLVQTALRHAKELTGLDLKSCQRWNPFLEIHYDRVGKNGLFSHKEVTVLYLPDLSNCLPLVDAWRDQWLAHKKAVAERERLLALKREICREKKESLKGKEPEKTKDVKKDVKTVKKKASVSSGSASKVNEKSTGKLKESGKEVVQSNEAIEKKDESNNSGKKDQVNVSSAQKTGSGKKKIIRKIVKKKVVEKDKLEKAAEQGDALDSNDVEKDKPEKAAEQSDALDSKKVVLTTTPTTNSEVAGQNEELIGNPPSTVKTFTRKNVAKKVAVKKPVKKEDVGTLSEVTPVKEQQSSENKPKSSSAKTTVKKKIIKRVMKRKILAKNANNTVKASDEAGVAIGEQSADLGKQENEVKLEVTELVSKSTAPSVVPDQMKDASSLNENETKTKGENIRVKEENKGKVDGGSSSKKKIDNNEKLKDGEKSDGKVKKLKDNKAEIKGKEVKDKKKDEEIPRHPGLFLQTKESKDSKLRSLSLSLDSLLAYDDNDTEESTFELSLFAETFYEMLQYQMGSRILTFLQRLRIKFVTKRNQKKRQLEDNSKKEKVKTSAKRAKTDNSKVESKPVKIDTVEEAQTEDEKTNANVKNAVTENRENMKLAGEDMEEDSEEEPEENPEEEPEEDPEEDEEMADASPKGNTDSLNIESKIAANDEKNAKETVKDIKLEDVEKKEKEKVEIKKKENIDKELLQAFRFFDRNRVGHIKVEDMRLIIHNLGNFLSHRDVKDLVQSALLESNTGRDDRILYNKLVRMDI